VPEKELFSAGDIITGLIVTCGAAVLTAVGWVGRKVAGYDARLNELESAEAERKEREERFDARYQEDGKKIWDAVTNVRVELVAVGADVKHNKETAHDIQDDIKELLRRSQ